MTTDVTACLWRHHYPLERKIAERTDATRTKVAKFGPGCNGAAVWRLTNSISNILPHFGHNHHGEGDLICQHRVRVLNCLILPEKLSQPRYGNLSEPCTYWARYPSIAPMKISSSSVLPFTSNRAHAVTPRPDPPISRPPIYILGTRS